MSAGIRFADPARDAAGILAVYAPYIRKTAVTFETEVPAPDAFTARVAGICADFGVSAEWLLLGRGKMLKNENNVH